MPNPDFTGTVPAMRCETCAHWERSGSGMTRGSCAINTTYVTVAPDISRAELFYTTDLAVCSNWKKKDDE